MVPFVFGLEWAPAGDYIRIFTTMYFARFIIAPVTSVNYIIGKQNYNTFFQALKFLSMIIGFAVGFYTSNTYAGLISWSLLLTISYLIILFYTKYLIRTVNLRLSPYESVELEPFQTS